MAFITCLFSLNSNFSLKLNLKVNEIKSLWLKYSYSVKYSNWYRWNKAGYLSDIFDISTNTSNPYTQIVLQNLIYKSVYGHDKKDFFYQKNCNSVLWWTNSGPDVRAKFGTPYGCVFFSKLILRLSTSCILESIPHTPMLYM